MALFRTAELLVKQSVAAALVDFLTDRFVVFFDRQQVPEWPDVWNEKAFKVCQKIAEIAKSLVQNLPLNKIFAL